ncbi:hypothetical protein HZC09_04940 [Candidatus Micrarchaeota archaeon]|nr:hypothetical protein [Candidatus Micrarchaeota archaeon]
MEEYALGFGPGWDEHFKKFDLSVKQQIWKKILRLQRALKHRHLKHGNPCFVEKAGGYRIAFRVDEEGKTKKVVFVGDHKQYEKWYTG